MVIVDQDGRLFGRINVFDAAVAIVLAAACALTIVGYRLLRLPTPPHVTKIVPSTLVSGPNQRITVSGDNLLPYLKVFIQRTNQPTAVMHDIAAIGTVSYDSYVLANAAQATLLVESPNLVEIRLPDDLLPGTYDLIFHNQTKIVGVQPAAFTVVASPPPKKAAANPEAIVRVMGAFTGLTREAAGTIAAGARFPHDSHDPWGEIVSVKAPTADTARLNFEDKKFTVRMINRWQVPATLRIRCIVTQFKCWLPNDLAIVPGMNLSLDVTGTPMAFAVADVLSDPPQRQASALVTIRFTARPRVAALLREQDIDLSPGIGLNDRARIVSIQRRAEVTGEFNEPLSDGGNIRASERLAVLECVVRVPITYTESGWQYRTQDIKAGAPMYFSTDRYVVRGTIESVTLASAAADGTR